MKYLFALCALTGSAFSQGTVWTVNLDGTADFTDIHAAVDAAADGDTVIIEEGGYFIVTPVEITKGLSLFGVGEVALTMFTFGGGNPPVINVHDLAADQAVSLRGLNLAGAYDDPANPLYIEDNLGPVHIEDVTSGAMGPGITLVDNESVTVVASTFLGSGGGIHSFVSGAVVTNTRAFFYDSEIYGTPGPLEECSIPFIQCTPAGWGGTGLRAAGTSEVLLSNCIVQGGDAGCDPAVGAAVGMDVGVGTIVRTRNSTIAGGDGGPDGCATPGMPAGPTSGGGTIVPVVGDARTFSMMPALAESGSAMTFTYEGGVGDFVFLLYRLGEPVNAGVWLDPLFALHLQVPSLGILPRGTVPVSGIKTDPITLPPIPASLSIQAQALFSTKEGPWVTTGPSTGMFYVP